MMRSVILLFLLAAMLPAPTSYGQSTSLLRQGGLQPIYPRRTITPNNNLQTRGRQGSDITGTSNPTAANGPTANDPTANAIASRPTVDPSEAPLTIDRVSWTYQPAPPLRTYRVHDIVTIRVDEITRMMAEGAAENRKRTLYEAILTDWIRLVDFRLRPDPQANGDPSAAFESNSNYRAESTVETRESMTFNIAASVVDIKPNGLLVLEASKGIRVNDNIWETSLLGMCRAEDIAPDNVVLSKDLIDLEIRKEDRGHLRDGYRRGWVQKFVDKVQPF